MQQIPLKLEFSQVENKIDLVKGKHNKEAIDFLFNSFISSLENIVFICGAKKVGKSFLTKLLVKELKGQEITLANISNLEKIEDLVKIGKVYLLEDIHSISKTEELSLLNFYNLLKHSNCKLILTSKLSVKEIKFNLPDLHSRLLSTKTIYIQEPDEDIITIIAFKMFQEKQLKTDLSVIKYIVNRIERKAEVLSNIIEDIEKEIFISKQKLSINLVKNVILKNNYTVSG